MPALLNYSVVTDPTALAASQPGAPSVGSLYVIVSNHHLRTVTWESIEVDLSGLTASPQDVTLGVRTDPPTPSAALLNFRWDGATGSFRLDGSSGAVINLAPGHSLTLELENIAVSGAGGLVPLKIREVAWGGDDHRGFPSAGESYGLTLGLVTSTPKVPRNFRPEGPSQVDVDAGANVVLAWEGPDNLDYWIRGADGGDVLVHTANPGPQVTQGSHTWSPPSAPRRGTTYTLVAGTGGGTGQLEQGYFLTTTVHARVPEFESGTRTPWVEGTTDKGRVAFTATGAEVRDGAGKWGTVSADKADVNGVRTKWVWGRDDSDGWIEFPSSGINVYHGTGKDWGTVSADKADVNGVRTKWVWGRNDSDGWISFPESGVNVYHGTGKDWGTVSADTADVNGVRTKWVRGRDDSDGWIEFPSSGINVYHGTGKEWGTVSADKADVNGVRTKWVWGRSDSSGWIDFPDSGIDVYHGTGKDWGTVSAAKADLNELVTGGALVKERLVVEGGITVNDVQGPVFDTYPSGWLDIKGGADFLDSDGQNIMRVGSRVNGRIAHGASIDGPLNVGGDVTANITSTGGTGRKL
ncbi:hypothetical protein [Streptomyces avicenniae]|uniref:hypothetical protein n=1 Tax=Streptomyces avicenniae TaxID=500153 RepID=UPI00069AA5F2|nr:hypothetical protein [Streptomyces avicenniae]